VGKKFTRVSIEKKSTGNQEIVPLTVEPERDFQQNEQKKRIQNI